MKNLNVLKIDSARMREGTFLALVEFDDGAIRRVAFGSRPRDVGIVVGGIPTLHIPHRDTLDGAEWYVGGAASEWSFLRNAQLRAVEAVAAPYIAAAQAVDDAEGRVFLAAESMKHLDAFRVRALTDIGATMVKERETFDATLTPRGPNDPTAVAALDLVRTRLRGMFAPLDDLDATIAIVRDEGATAEADLKTARIALEALDLSAVIRGRGVEVAA